MVCRCQEEDVLTVEGGLNFHGNVSAICTCSSNYPINWKSTLKEARQPDLIFDHGGVWLELDGYWELY